MSRARIPSLSSQARQKRLVGQDVLKLKRFIGLDLGGGKNSKTSLVVLDYYPGQNKLFLSQVFGSIGQENELSGDQALFEIIQENLKDLEYLSVGAPLSFPKCIRCKLKCPGFEKCKEPEIQYMWKLFRSKKKNKRRIKIFTPYTTRVAEMYIGTEIGESIVPPESLGANHAPLTARAHFLIRRLPKKIKTLEVIPKLSALRIGEALKVSRSHLQYYAHPIGGDESRHVFLEEMVNRDAVFIYHQDFQKLTTNADSFEAFLIAFTGFLKYLGQCENRPKDLPRSERWIEFPKKNPSLKA